MHRPDANEIDLFCRIFVQTEETFGGLVALVAEVISGTARGNSVRSAELDVSVMENDLFDPVRSVTGEDRWLAFRYTLELDPVEGISRETYLDAVARLLKTLWASGIDAVAACEFEDWLPRNDKRLAWNT